MIDPAIQYENYYKGAWELADKAQEIRERYVEFFEERGVDTSDPWVEKTLKSLSERKAQGELSQMTEQGDVEIMLDEAGVSEAEAEKIMAEFERIA